MTVRGAIFAGTLAIATTAMAAPKTILIVDCNAACDGSTLMTDAIQKSIDAAAPKGGTVTFKPGTYLTGALFLKSGVTFEIPEGVTITGSQDIKDFPELPTRMAGIELTWPASLINVRDAHDVTITGKGPSTRTAPSGGRSTRTSPRSTCPRACAGQLTTTPNESGSPLSRTPKTSTTAVASLSSAQASGPSRFSTPTTSPSTASSSATTKAAAAHPRTASTSTRRTTSISPTPTSTATTMLSALSPDATPMACASTVPPTTSRFTTPSSTAAQPPSPSAVRPPAASTTSRPGT